jgi:hypothetical protein
MRSGPAGLLLVACCLLAAGCGDDGNSTPLSTTTGPPTKRAFLISADQICNSFESQIEAAGDDLFTGKHQPPPRRVRQFALHIAVPKLEAEIDAVRSLGAPRGDADEIDAILAASQRGVDQIRRDPELIAGGQAPPGLKQAGRLAKTYGSEECGAQ